MVVDVVLEVIEHCVKGASGGEVSIEDAQWDASYGGVNVSEIVGDDDLGVGGNGETEVEWDKESKPSGGMIGVVALGWVGGFGGDGPDGNGGNMASKEVQVIAKVAVMLLAVMLRIVKRCF